ncbi:hypothetical protein [Catenuloplanes atrovinosus]|uniref:Peptidase metallopeptidase domain-containing protein n=1 Tax=Catenuloplanes atrovinosus TaxID=137266 RepID=A0AAE4C7Y6_9ACTN|nr:hypothetical protein [Catenuloplanes atrovinosus]MDR7274077.1 hypothetical protein [Catenuloplanes atrovinosus]
MLDSLPEPIEAAVEVRDAWRRRVAAETAGLEFLVQDLSRWAPGAVLRVAFLDGDTEAHAKVEEATRQITDVCGITLDFGRDPATGAYRRWTTKDTEYAAEIRVSFDQGGYWSLVGTDSTDATLADASSPIGGAPHQRSLNLSGFDGILPDDWAGTVRHEFLHALAFKHTHQNMRGPCADEFRWEDDEGYVPTKDPRGVFVADEAGRRPGVYTYLAGPPNRWTRAKVDFNLRTRESDETLAGPFDAKSVMLYQFEPFFYKTAPSPCAPAGNGIDLSEGDVRGLQVLYPRAAEPDLIKQASTALATLSGGLESATANPYRQRLVDVLSGLVEGRVP